MTFISLLRGINVSGQKKILMADLKALYESLGFGNVKTYIQSGNVIFETDSDSGDALAKKIENKIKEVYQFEVPVLNLTQNEISKALNENPFLQESDIVQERLYVSFLSELPHSVHVEKIDASLYLPDRFIVKDKFIFLSISPNGYGNTKLSNNFFESKLKVKATTRNWKTIQQLGVMSYEFFALT